MNICTIIAKNYLAHARVLARSFREHHPDGECFVLVIDETDGYIEPGREPFTLVQMSEIGLEDYDEMRGAYDVLEFSTAVKPWLLRHMLESHDDGTGVAYFDPDIRVMSRMVELERELLEHAVVLTPHVTTGMPRDGLKPAETDILVAGVYNLGFIGLSGRDDAHLLLDWWSERLRTDCHVAPERGLFVDQRWVDFVPGLVEDLAIFRHPAYNVAYWNLFERDLEVDGDDYRAGGETLRFFHFSGYDPRRPETLSKHQTRVRIGESAALQRICGDYGNALLDAGFEEVRTWPYDHDRLPSGARLTGLMRGLYRAGLETGDCRGSVFTPAGEAELLAYLSEPAPEEPALTRVLHALWEGRPDLQRAYPYVGGADLEGFLGWCATYAADQAGIPPALLPDRPAAQPSEIAVSGPPATELAVALPPLFGVNVAGYLRAELGIGEVARQLVSALDAAQVPVMPVGLFAPNSRQGHAFSALGHDRNPFPVNIVCVNADGLPEFAREAGREFFADRYSVGVWWWETSDFPERFRPSFDLLQEIWVGSRFVAETLSAVSPIPVVHVPVALDFPAAPPLRPGELGWPDAFTFLFSYDYNSVTRRKNPLGVVEAYTRAFGPDDGAALVLKCINHDFDPAGHRLVREAIAGRTDIVLVDAYLDARDKNRMMASCDCYVSLHRSEGFGLTMAEAMLLGKPVIATGYSGNMDFMTSGNSYPVDYDLVPIGEGAAPYDPEGIWAEPDLEDAASLLRHVFEHRDEAAAKGAKGREDVRAVHSPDAVGRVLRARLERIASRLPETAAGEPVAGPAADEAKRLVARGSMPTRRSRFGKAGSGVRKGILRAIKPYTAYQEQVNRALQGTLDEQTRHLETLRAERRADDRKHLETATALMGELRGRRSEIGTLREELAVLRQTVDEALAAFPDPAIASRMVAEARALPYMSADVFTTFDAPGAGRVYGYTAADAAAGEPDAYRAFEDLFRGSEAFIADRQRRYVDLVRDAAPVLDVGCGRGEFLDVLAEAGVPATGVDADAGMVARCREKGHADTVHGDGIEYLAGLEDASLGTVFAAQVVEHLPPEALERFLAAAARKLRPGGLLIAETVNPHSVGALKTFWVDVTHQHPLFPEAMLAWCRIAGFSAGYVFHPNGAGDVETDRYTTGEYAVVARR